MGQEMLETDQTSGTAVSSRSRADAGTAASSLAQQHLNSIHPRVRWAALEVWARMLSRGLVAPCQSFDATLESLMAIASRDQYTRVRRRALLVLLFFTNCADTPLAASHVEPVFRRVLIPLASSHDEDIRTVCFNIGQQLVTWFGLTDRQIQQGCTEHARGAEIAASIPSEFVPLWNELEEAVSRANATHGAGGYEDTCDISWPVDWR